MKLVCERKPLLEALTLAARLAERRSTIPILGHIKLATGKGKLTVTGTNMDRVGSADTAAAIGKAGSTTANAELLLNFVRNAPDGSQVELEQNDPDRLVVKAGRARVSLPALPATDFPDISEGEFDALIELPADRLARAIGFVQHAAATEETRRYLGGVYLHLDDDDLHVVACDGFSLGHRILRGDGKAVFEPVIIPREALDSLRNLAGDAAGDVSLEISEARVRLSGRDRRISTKLIDGVYPDYQRIIPKSAARGFSAGRTALEAAVTRCTALATNKDRTLRVETIGQAVRISARSTDAGDIVDEIDAETRGGDAAFHIHAVRMGQALAALACPDVEVGFNGEQAIVFRNPQDPNSLQMVGSQKG